jgi:hypothetical protein
MEPLLKKQRLSGPAIRNGAQCSNLLGVDKNANDSEVLITVQSLLSLHKSPPRHPLCYPSSFREPPCKKKPRRAAAPVVLPPKAPPVGASTITDDEASVDISSSDSNLAAKKRIFDEIVHSDPKSARPLLVKTLLDLRRKQTGMDMPQNISPLPRGRPLPAPPRLPRLAPGEIIPAPSYPYQEG